MDTQSGRSDRLAVEEQKLVRMAVKARLRAYAPYSKYLVGCAVEDENGQIHTGCNVENASYPAVSCAERVAICKMVSRGSRRLSKLVVAASSKKPTFPCGVCLQIISEFGAGADIIAVDPEGEFYRRAKFSELFPFNFTSDKLNE